MLDNTDVGRIMTHLARGRELVSFELWDLTIKGWLSLFRLNVPSFNEAEFLLAIGYEAELYRVQNGDANGQ